MRWIQRYVGGKASPPCEHIDQCGYRAIGMWVDAEGNVHDWCAVHAATVAAPPMEEGIWYAPTHT